MIKRATILLLLLTVLFSASSVWAETLYLKNGKQLVGEIIEDTPTHVKIIVNGIPFMYFRDEIDRIDKGAASSLRVLADKPPRSLSEIPNTKKALIRKLLEVNGARASISQVFESLLQNVPADQVAYYRDFLKVDEIFEGLIPVYDKYLTDEDITIMIDFYSGPTGQKIIERIPLILRESAQRTAIYFQGKTKQK